MKVLKVFGLGIALALVACSSDDSKEENVASNDSALSGGDDERGRGNRDYVDPLENGPYLAGSKSIFVRDPSRRFDPWNEVYGSSDYKTLLTHLNAIGEPRTLVTEVWYPVERPRGCGDDHGHGHGHDHDGSDDAHCRPGSAQHPTYLDYYFGDRSIFDRRSISPYMITASGQPVAAIQASHPAAFATLEHDVLDELANRKRGSWANAPIANGRFPVVVLSHGGFTGNVRPDSSREMWTSLGEKLASHGYIVVAMNHTGDSRLPAVFHDAGSKLRQQDGQAAVNAAYETIFSQAPVPDRITGLIFQPGGFPIANEMMQHLFEMRADDVMSVIKSIKSLNNDRHSFLGGHVDTDHIGVSGHSLGSMTTQIVLASEKSVTTGIGWNNGLPKSWEPPRFKPIKKPALLTLAYEDDLSRTFFTNVPFMIYPNAVPGGQPSDYLFLESERVFPPTLANPEPVVRSCYGRLQGPKELLGFVDSTHWDVTDYDDYLFPRHRLAAGETKVAVDNVLQHLPFGQDVLNPNFVGASYPTVSWTQVGGEWEYTPHVMRDYYSIAWFGRYLKGIGAYANDLQHDPFGDKTVVLNQGIRR